MFTYKPRGEPTIWADLHNAGYGKQTSLLPQLEGLPAERVKSNVRIRRIAYLYGLSNNRDGGMSGIESVLEVGG